VCCGQSSSSVAGPQIGDHPSSLWLILTLTQTQWLMFLRLKKLWLIRLHYFGCVILNSDAQWCRISLSISISEQFYRYQYDKNKVLISKYDIVGKYPTFYRYRKLVSSQFEISIFILYKFWEWINVKERLNANNKQYDKALIIDIYSCDCWIFTTSIVFSVIYVELVHRLWFLQLNKNYEFY